MGLGKEESNLGATTLSELFNSTAALAACLDMEPPRGLEPLTYGLQGRCATSCATMAW